MRARHASQNFQLTLARCGGRISREVRADADAPGEFVFTLLRNRDNKVRARWLRFSGVALLAVLGSACASLNPPTPEQKAEKIDGMLAAAGFKELPADTPAKQQSLNALPPLKVTYYDNKEGERQYWMADPYACKCLYLGDDAAYGRYWNFKLQQQIAHEQEQAARENLEMQQDMQMDMGMAPWGFSPGVGFGIW